MPHFGKYVDLSVKSTMSLLCTVTSIDLVHQDSSSLRPYGGRDALINKQSEKANQTQIVKFTKFMFTNNQENIQKNNLSLSFLLTEVMLT